MDENNTWPANVVQGDRTDWPPCVGALAGDSRRLAADLQPVSIDHVAIGEAANRSMRGARTRRAGSALVGLSAFHGIHLRLHREAHE